MEDLKILFLLLFFSKTVVLTASPISIDEGWTTLRPKEPLTAITGGAAIYVDVTEYLKPLGLQPFDFAGVAKVFPEGVVEGRLLTEGGSEIELRNLASSHGNDVIRLIVGPEGSMPTELEFVEVKLRSQVPIDSVRVFWKNGKH